jgi:hypothetical protein
MRKVGGQSGGKDDRVKTPIKHRMLFSGLTNALIFFALTGLAQSPQPERKVSDNFVTSQRDPKVRIELPKTVQYAGADRWVLYDIADCELHAFVEADQAKRVQRLYWIQFESYVPTRPELHHTYESPRHEIIGGMDFYVDTGPSVTSEPPKPGSDSEHIRRLIRGRGFQMPENVMMVRLVHLLDKQKRKELMIIYGEDLTPTGFTAADLKKGGKAESEWPELENGVIAHAKKAIQITQ